MLNVAWLNFNDFVTPYPNEIRRLHRSLLILPIHVNKRLYVSKESDLENKDWGVDMRVVTFKEEEIWVGVVLDHYIVAQGLSKEDLETNLFATICSELADREGDLSAIKAAPARFHNQWNPNDESTLSTKTQGGVKMSLQHVAA